MTEEEMYNKLVVFVRDASGLDTIRDQQNGPRFNEDYGMINLISLTENGEVSCRSYTRTGTVPTETVTEFIARHWTWVFSINFYHKYPTDAARKVIDKMDREGNPLHPCVVEGFSPVRRLPELINKRWEPRSQFDVTISGIVKDGVIIDAIDRGNVIVAAKEGTFRPDTTTPNNCEQLSVHSYNR